VTSAARQPGSRILGTGHYLPAKVVTNQDLEKVMDTSDEWIRGRTGIAQRHFASDDEASSDLATNAARKALEMAGLAATDLDLIIVGTISPDVPMPSCAVFVQRALGTRKTCPAFDLSAACAGFVYGLSIADAYIRAGIYKHILVVGVELLSRIVDWNDRSSCVLFGDGAGAVVMGPAQGDGRGVLSTHIFSDGSMIESLIIPGGGSRMPFSQKVLDERKHLVHMVGTEVFKYAVKGLSASVMEALSANNMTPGDIDWVVPHQANVRILDAVQHRTGIPKERFFVNIADTANTSSASVPIALDQAVRKGLIKQGQSLVFCALGGGIAWGSALVRW
jgi:3-oxoacyl-[acyl-carrier-protein] synthase-3